MVSGKTRNMTTSLSTAADFISQTTLFNTTLSSTSTSTSTATSSSLELDDYADYLQNRVVPIVVPIFFSIVVFVGLFGNLLVSFERLSIAS